LRASATTIIFAPGSKQLTLNGNASLQQGGNTIRSEQILYDVAARQIRADGKQDRVRMEFDVQEKPVDDAASATAEP
jgi:lipopolysaccharide transport protein LptA